MKFTKILTLALVALTMTACSDDDDFNTAGGVTVNMAESEITVKENAGRFYVPVTVTGEPNAPVQVQLQITGSGSNPAKPVTGINGDFDGNLIVTSETIYIPADEKTAAVEISTVDDLEENEDRTFTVTIVAAEGATIGNQTTTTVTLKDNDAVPYEKVQGTWKFNATSAYDGPISWTVNIAGEPEGTPAYDKELVLEGLLGASTSLSLSFHTDEATGETFVEMNLPEPIVWYDQTHYIWVLNGMSTAPASVRGTFSADLQTITFNPEAELVFYVASPDFSDQLGTYERVSGITMTR